MATDVRIRFSAEEYRILSAMAEASGCTKTEFLRRLFFEWRDEHNLLLTSPKHKEF